MTVQNAPGSTDIPPRLRFSVPRAVRWGVSDVGLAIGALVLSLVAGVVLQVSGVAYDPDAAQFAIGLAGYALIVLVILRASYAKGQRSLRADFGFAIRPLDVLIGIGVGLVLRIVSVLFVLGAIAATGHTPESGNFTLSDRPLWIVLNGVVLASLVAPIVEELMVRGLVLQSVRNIVLRWRNREQPAEPAQQRRAVWISVVVSALVFAALHSGQSADTAVVIALALSTFALGLANGWLVYATGRLGAGIVAHITFNGSSVFVAVLASGLLGG